MRDPGQLAVEAFHCLRNAGPEGVALVGKPKFGNTIPDEISACLSRESLGFLAHQIVAIEVVEQTTVPSKHVEVSVEVDRRTSHRTADVNGVLGKPAAECVAQTTDRRTFFGPAHQAL